MKRIRPQDTLRFVRTLPILVAGALICALMIAVTWSCARRQIVSPQQPLTHVGVPTVRVRVTPQSVDRLALATTGPYRLRVDDVVISESAGAMRETVFTRVGETWRCNLLNWRGNTLVIEPIGETCIRLAKKLYRGQIHLLGVDEKRFIAVNHLDMESYLAGVLPKELYPSWSEQTYRAQAVAARTFAMYYILTRDEQSDYDLGSTQASQVYGGFSAETPKAWDAVRSTHGQVLTFGTEGDERVFMAQYSASCGGRVNPVRAIRNARDIPPLKGGQVCTDCEGSSRYRWSPVRITKADLHRALVGSYRKAADLKGVRELRPVEATDHGRIVWVDVLGRTGKSIRLRAEDIRLALLRNGPGAAKKLYSMNCLFRERGDSIEFYDGRGFGHGVGLCQWGAQRKASTGSTAEEILQFYYPQAKLLRAY